MGKGGKIYEGASVDGASFSGNLSRMVSRLEDPPGDKNRGQSCLAVPALQAGSFYPMIALLTGFDRSGIKVREGNRPESFRIHVSAR